MKKLYLCLMIFFVVISFNSVIYGVIEEIDRNIDGLLDNPYMADDSSYRISDSPYLRLPDDKLNWPSIAPPPSGEAGIVVEDPTAVEIYNVATEEVTEIPSYSPTQKQVKELSDTISPYEGLLPPGSILETVFPPDGRTQVSNTASYPWRTVVKLFITHPGGQTGGCSGAIIDGFHVLTAGHCVYLHDELGWSYDAWASSIEVVPGLDDDYMPYNHSWTTYMRSYTGWTSSRMHEHDWAVITLDRNMGSFTGWMGRMTASSSSSIYTDIVNTAGYPGDRGGLTMWFDADTGRTANENNHWYYMDTFRGQSGSPVWRYVSGNRYILTVHAYGDDGTSSNHGTRLNNDKYDRINTWVNSDTPPTDYADLIDDGQAYSGFSPTSVIPGLTSFETWNDVRNVGTALSGGFYVSYYASTNTTITTYDYLIGTAYVSSISPFSWRDSDWSGTFPSDIPPGTYWVGWIIDSDDDVTEFDETNNIDYKNSYQLTVTEAPLPDLYCVSFTAPSQAEPGDPVGHLLNLVAGNQGSGDAGSFFVGIYISVDPQITTSDQLLIGGREYVDSLMAGQTYNVPLYSGMSIPSNLSPGSYYIGALLDEFNDVDETNENNNYESHPITIGSADVVTVELTPDSTSVPQGGTLGYEVTATNHTSSTQCFDYWTNVTLPNGNQYPPSGELFGPYNLCLNPYDSRSAHLTQPIPMAAPVGTYSYNARVGPYPAVQDQDHFGFTVISGTREGGSEVWQTIIDQDFTE